ncbi:MAG: glycoside hydrolase, family 38 [Thermoleophilia bacterium]|nr:glycoside hydrolase, family 38 [Thermoleophilia bacterium]
MSRAPAIEGPDLQPALLRPPDVPGSAGWRVHVYAHTHWDREWYRTHERFRIQLVGVVDRLLHTLDSDPRFSTFVLDGQMVPLEDYLEVRPEEEPRIRRLVGAGRLEVGPWYVLPDEFLVSGEALVRNLLEGRRVASRFGEPLAVGYLPDPFGHAAQLPAILRGFGIDNAIFSRGMHDEFEASGSELRWEAADGTDVLAIVQTSPYTNGYCNAELFGRGNGPDDDAPYDAARELAPLLADGARADVLLFAAGCDHETVQPELPDIVERLEQVLPGADVRITGLDAVVASVRDAERRLEADGRPLHRYRGELRGSLHAPILASIFSARIPLKQENDHIQGLLERHVEPLMATAVLAGVRPARDVLPFLRRAWRTTLKNHPHDSIGGCSVDHVHEEMPARSLRVRSIANGLLEDLRIALDLGGTTVVHDGEGCGGIAELGDGSAVAIRPGVPGVLAPLDELLVQDADVEVLDDRTVRAGGLVARVATAPDGVSRLEVDPGTGGEPIAVDFVDVADAGDEYDFGRVAGDVERIATLVGWASRAGGPGVAELVLAYDLPLPVGLTADRSARAAEEVDHRIDVVVRVSAASPLAQLVVELDNRALDHRLRARASAGVRGVRVESHGHFAVIDRTARPAQPRGAWKQEPPGLDHCLGAVRLVQDGPEPRDLLIAGRGLHEYEVHEHPAGARDGETSIELTLLRSVGWLSRDDVEGRPGHAGPGLPTPGAQCLGRHRVDLAVGSVLRPGMTPEAARLAAVDAAREYLAPPLVLEPFGIEARQESGALARARDVLEVTPDGARARVEALGLRVGGEGVVPSATKLADDGSGDLVVRWWAPVGTGQARARLELDPAVRVASVLRARLDETPQGPAPFADGTCEVAVRPGAILTLRVALER